MNYKTVKPGHPKSHRFKKVSYLDSFIHQGKTYYIGAGLYLE